MSQSLLCSQIPLIENEKSIELICAGSGFCWLNLGKMNKLRIRQDQIFSVPDVLSKFQSVCGFGFRLVL